MNVDSMPREWPRHGGEVAAAADRYGIPVPEWLDLSTGINPEPWPVPSVHPDLYARLPQVRDYEELLRAARTAYEIPDGVALAALPGTELAIRLAPGLMPPGEATAIFSPTYESYRHAWEASGRHVKLIERGANLPPELRCAVVANPNNPDGRTLPRDAVGAMASMLAGRSGLLLVDEAYADPNPEVSVCPLLNRAPALVLRSFGKFYGLPGLRLGFVAGHAEAVGRIAGLLGDWPVSTAAIEIGTAALRDSAWRETARRRLAADAQKLRTILGRNRLSVVGGTPLFALVEDEDALAIHRALAEQGVLTRVFRYAPTWIRFGLPPAHAFERLERALTKVAASRPPSTAG